MGGKLVLPGLFDSHIQPLDIVYFDVCNLDSRPTRRIRGPYSPTRVMRKLSETPMCSRPGSWANGFT
jgi:hypothetical protein